MSIFLLGLALVLLGILLPAGIVLGIFLGIRLLLWWFDRALNSSDDDDTPTT